MPNLTVLQPPDNLLVTAGQPVLVSGHATDKGMPEPVEIDSVTVRVDGGAPIEAAITRVPHQKLTTVRFTAPVQVLGEGPHTITATATNDQGISASKVVVVLVAAASCVYPASNPTTRPVMEELEAVAASSGQCASFYLDAFDVRGCGKPICQPRAFVQLSTSQAYQGSSIAVSGGKVLLNSTDNTPFPAPSQTNLYVLALP